MKLNQLIAQYVAFRKSLGRILKAMRHVLRTFSRFVGEGADDRLCETTPKWQRFLPAAGPSPATGTVKYSVLRGFFSYAVTRGYLSASPLPATVPKQPARFVPHIYSRRSCAASSTARRPIRNISRES